MPWGRHPCLLGPGCTNLPEGHHLHSIERDGNQAAAKGSRCKGTQDQGGGGLQLVHHPQCDDGRQKVEEQKNGWRVQVEQGLLQAAIEVLCALRARGT